MTEPPPPLCCCPWAVRGHLIIWDDGTTWSHTSGPILPLGDLREVSGQLLIVGAPPNRTEGTTGNYLTGLYGLGALEVND
jgi:hypothetical protein